MSALPTLEGFDVKAAVARMLGQPELWWQALALFETHFGGWAEHWPTAGDDPGLERRKVHALRSASANIGAVRLALDAEVLESFLLERPAESDSPVAQGLRRQLQQEFDKVRAEAARALAEHRGAAA